jgi:hypothetical protein
MNDNTPAYQDGSLADQALGAFAKICSELTGPDAGDLRSGRCRASFRGFYRT